MTVTLTMSPRNKTLAVAGWEEGTALGNMMGEYATKKGYIAPRVILNTSNFITVVDFSENFKDEDLIHWTSTLYGTSLSWLVFLSIFYPLLHPLN